MRVPGLGYEDDLVGIFIPEGMKNHSAQCYPKVGLTRLRWDGDEVVKSPL